MGAMTWIDAHKNERFTDNRKVKMFSLCKTCTWREQTHDGYKKFVCDVYTQDNQKPLSIMFNGDCDFYKEE